MSGTKDDASTYHVVPMNDLREHELTYQCWCAPTCDAEEHNVWVHNAMDERETYERGRKMH